MDNIFKGKIPKEGEIFDSLLEHKNIKIERIISSGKKSDKIYIQEHDEWVLLLKGVAKLDIEGKEIEMKEGDYVFIPFGQKHRVLETKIGTVWLAIHIYSH